MLTKNNKNLNPIIMKKIFTILAICCAVLAVNAQNTFHETFNNGIPSTWTVLDVNNNGNSWVAVGPLMESLTSGNYTGSLFDYEEDENGDAASSWSYYPVSWTTEGFGGTSQNTNNYLITPAITPSANSTLSFYCMSFNGTQYPDDLAVKVSRTGDNASDFTETIMPKTTIAWSEYAEKSFDLSAFAGQSIRIAFIHQSNDQFGVLVDEVTVTNTSSVGINEVEETCFTIFPNPVTSNLNVKGEGTVEIINAIGQVVLTDNVNGNAILNVSNLDNGIYFVRMNGATQKFIKK